MKSFRIGVAVLAATLLYGAAGGAGAGGGTKEFSDTKRGFTVRIPDTLKQNPPKPSGDPKYMAANFYDDQAKYKSSGSVNPEFTIGWWSTPKTATTPGTKPDDKPPEGGDHRPTRDEMEDMYGPKSVDAVLDSLLNHNPQLFGKVEGPAASSERWTQAKSGKTTKGKIDFKYWEFDPGKPKKGEQRRTGWYVFAARLSLARPNEAVEVSFHATCDIQFIKDLGPAFLNVVKSFETQEASGVGAREEVPTDPEKFREYIKRTKVITGWKYAESPKKQYCLLYDEGVKDDLIKEIGQRIEGIRAQVYEQMFPPDKPVTAVSVIRVCKDKQQYMAYGGSPSSAGYWQWSQQELVFYKDSSNPGDAYAVLYHEAFHQYIFYSVGACSPHSWFNEGHGDFFAGHVYKGAGKFELDEFKWRKDLAASVKREKKTVPLKDWLTWDQGKYYNEDPKLGLTAIENYALGWNFIYFLRTTKKADYQQFLPVYFNALKSLVTAAREERRARRDKAKAAGETLWEEQPEAIENMSKESEWCQTALNAALKTVDLDQLEKDWLAF